jgi:phenylacetate-CoA ligase
MDLQREFIRRFSWDFYLRRDGYDLAASRRVFCRSQWLDTEALTNLQLARLQRLLSVAYSQNAFYRRRFDDIGFAPGDLRCIADLKQLPLLTKDQIRAGLAENLTAGFARENTLHKRTGGSTGVPLHIHMDYSAASAKRAATERHNGWAGYQPGDRLAAVWGDTSRRPSLKSRVRNALTERAFYLDTLRFDSIHVDQFVSKLRELRPPILMGHAHSIFRLAEHIERTGVTDVRFRGVITTAMVLSPTERAVIEHVFRSPVFDRYGCEEMSIIASECEAHTGLHIFCEGLIVELGEGPDAHPRPLVITDLLNFAMPLIRYEIGDHGSFIEGRCSCGRSLPRLGGISGRTADFLYTPEGTPVFGISILDTFVIHIPGFKQVQIIQDRIDHLHFQVVRGPNFDEASESMLAMQVKQVFGVRMRYDVAYVEQIAQTERGKFRFSICAIPDRSSPISPPQ